MDLSLHPKQMEALTTKSTEILYGGAVGGGKSHLLRVAAIVYSIQVPGLQTYIFRKTYKELIANHIHTPGGFPELLKEFIDDGLVKWGKTDNSFEFANGSRVQLAHCQWESDVTNYQGAQIGFLCIDESTHLSDKVYKFLRSRVRLGSLEVPEDYKGMFPRILACSNPGGLSHSFWKREFVDHGISPWKTNPAQGGMLRQYIPSKVDDNPTLTNNDPGYKDRIRGMGQEHLIEAMLEGNWDVIAGGAIDDLWTPELHVVKPFRIPRSWRVDRAYDYGSSAPYGVLYFAQSTGEEVEIAPGVFKSFCRGSLFICGEIYGANAEDEGLRQTAQEQAKVIRRYEQETIWFSNAKPGPADNSIFDTDRGDSIADLMANEGILWLGSDKTPGSRVNGLSKIRQMLKNVIEGDEFPGLYFFSTCGDSLRLIPSIPRDDVKIEDVDTKANDHLYDVLRYKVLSIDNIPIQLDYKGY